MFYIDGHACTAPALAPGLYVTSTPIGNLADVTLRALQVLSAADLVFCEDTRVTRKLTRKYGIEAILRPYHDHNAEKVRPEIVNKLLSGASVALVSDAGTPLVSDPGFKLVRAACENGVSVVAVPGPSAPLAALAVSGLPSDRFLFAGFPPARSGQRRNFLEGLRETTATLVLFCAARSLGAVLEDVEAVLGDRPAVMARELTKLHEEVLRGPIGELRRLIEGRALKGEVTLLVGGHEAAGAPDQDRLDAEIEERLRDASVKDVAAELAKAYDLPRRQVYERALELSARRKGRG